MDEELLSKINELESRIDALEQNSCKECDDNETCPECGKNPCICDDDTSNSENDASVDAEISIIDDDDVDEIEELNFDIPRFMVSDDYENDDTEEEADGGLYDYESSTDDEDDEENSPYYGD